MRSKTSLRSLPLALFLLLAIAWTGGVSVVVPSIAAAQPADGEEEDDLWADDEDWEDDDEWDDEGLSEGQEGEEGREGSTEGEGDGEGDGELTLSDPADPEPRGPRAEESDDAADEGNDEGEGDDEGDAADDIDTGDDAALLRGDAPDSDPTRSSWTSPQSVLTLHGYLRVRGEWQDNFFLSQPDAFPFSVFRPGGREAVVDGDCTSDSAACGRDDKLRFANMRVRLQPTLALSDDVRVHLTLDIFDNMVLGSSPDYVGDSSLSPGGSSGAPIDFAWWTVNPRTRSDSFRDSIYVRRAWAEVTNRELGQLRFGRMAHEWGLGMLYNAGDGIDDDFSSEIDRIQALTRFSDFYFGASWDFAGQGIVMSPYAQLGAVPFDFTDRDDIRQFSFLAARRLDEDTQAERLANDDWVLNAGLYFLIRRQSLSSEGAIGAIDPLPSDASGLLVRRNARQFTPDLWVQFLYRSLRLELEAAMHIGRIQNAAETGFTDNDYRILSFGFAFQGEYRLMDDKLGIYFDTGLATGDSQTRGLSNRENTFLQQDGNRQLTHFGFHPNYRIDLLLFRNILGNVGGVWYLRPGVSYDLVRTAYGQRAGARVDVIYSRANRESQAYGDAQSLGLELDASIYYRSEDGPGLTDGFYAGFHYGILFPFAGLDALDTNPGKAQTLRLVLGVEY